MSQSNEPISLAITGASGAPYALRLLEQLLRGSTTVYLMISSAARVVLKEESDIELPREPAAVSEFFSKRFGTNKNLLRVFGEQDWFAPVASGSNPPRAMVVCPCTVGTLSAIAAGASNNLMERAADVMLKEQRKLILVVRETPLSAIHLENMLKLARLGAVIMPASPGFYHRPQRVEGLVDFMVARVLDHLGIEHQLTGRWG
jgi:4-hydroxy-3-polyprenylbenzoate decarboxylase